MKSVDLTRIYNILFNEFGPQNWWPADTSFEVVVGAVLTQQTKWTNVERAIGQMQKKGLIDPENMAEADIREIEELVYCCGFYRQKAARLKQIAQHFSRRGENNIFSLPVNKMRKELLSLKGIGYETADSIILYAAEKPKFVIDAYTTRIMECMDVSGNYRQLQELFESEIPEDTGLYKEFHALIVEYAKKYCTKKRCTECLLKIRVSGAGENGY
ncbi:HhH-GPD family protein [Methanosalsum zhilinae DSM 4017]|uniref:HhH-GPD family protein n=1 Tax=Methanosalsum zhilinae (strain DSM 4017 / NBRC 107636 / OCM 62 / WeN5) TaxID=679901 RepID=F7XKG8_METZD|nr:DNA-3-methyladenine glycosylase [Methanosalsum zhilinae]AEH61742.1 HhH-GPD family protein [Methanosalsum zhilinae DSM 4017]